MQAVCSRREALAILGGAGLSLRSHASFAAPSESLGEIAAANGLVFGSAIGPSIFKDFAYRDLYPSQTRIVTTDVALKIGTIAPKPRC